jgi:hypothetical protein
MLIFHRFPSAAAADNFAIAVRDRYGLLTRVCANQAHSDQVDPFPFRLTAPIVLVECRVNVNIPDVAEMFADFGGRFAGT